MFIIFYILPILIVYKFYNYYRVELKALKAENDLLIIQNKLRFSRRAGLLDFRDPKYILLDLNITLSIDFLKRLNLWPLLYVAYKSKDNPEFKELRDFKKIFKSNRTEMDLFEQYSTVIITFFKDKSKFSIWICRIVIVAYRSILKIFKPDLKRNEFLVGLRGKLEYMIVNPQAFAFAFRKAA